MVVIKFEFPDDQSVDDFKEWLSQQGEEQYWSYAKHLGWTRVSFLEETDENGDVVIKAFKIEESGAW